MNKVNIKDSQNFITSKYHIEVLLGELRLYLYQGHRGKIGSRSLYGFLEYERPVAPSTLRSDNPADTDMGQLGARRTHTAHGHYPVATGQPQMNGRLVAVVDILIHTVLLNDEYGRADVQQVVKF